MVPSTFSSKKLVLIVPLGSGNLRTELQQGSTLHKGRRDRQDKARVECWKMWNHVEEHTGLSELLSSFTYPLPHGSSPVFIPRDWHNMLRKDLPHKWTFAVGVGVWRQNFVSQPWCRIERSPSGPLKEVWRQDFPFCWWEEGRAV